MRKTLKITAVILAALAVAPLCAQSDIERGLSPALRAFGENLCLYARFDGDKALMLAGPDGVTIQKSNDFKTGAGRSGAALETGKVTLKGGPLIDFGASGTLIMWISPQNWSGKKTAEMPYILPFVTTNEQITVMAGLQGQTTKIYAHVMLPDKKKIHLAVYGGAANWKDGSWHMLAVNWSSDSMGISLDGSEFITQALASPIPGGPVKKIELGNASSGKPSLALEEFTVLNKKLSSAEIKKLYAAAVKNSAQDL
jgi:hypothetical protein